MDFEFDVFLSHSSEDKAIVRQLAEDLRDEGVRVWLDDWEIAPGTSIPAAIDAGLASSRTLLLCMSESTFGSEWAELETYSIRFREPMNRELRFLPVRLDNVEAPPSLAHFKYVDLREPGAFEIIHRSVTQRELGDPSEEAKRGGERLGDESVDQFVSRFNVLDRGQRRDSFDNLNAVQRRLAFTTLSSNQRAELFDAIDQGRLNLFGGLNQVRRRQLFDAIDRDQRRLLYQALDPDQRRLLYQALDPDQRTLLDDDLT